VLVKPDSNRASSAALATSHSRGEPPPGFGCAVLIAVSVCCGSGAFVGRRAGV